MTHPDLNKCQCSFRIRMVGDGCQYCNPEYWKRYLTEDEYEQKISEPKMSKLEGE